MMRPLCSTKEDMFWKKFHTMTQCHYAWIWMGLLQIPDLLMDLEGKSLNHMLLIFYEFRVPTYPFTCRKMVDLSSDLQCILWTVTFCIVLSCSLVFFTNLNKFFFSTWLKLDSNCNFQYFIHLLFFFFW